MNKLCAMPWVAQSFKNNGDIRVCCQANPSYSRGIIRDQNGNPFNGEFSNLDEARNGALLKDIRKSMMDGKWHPACIRCKTEEEANQRSHRKDTIGECSKLTEEFVKGCTQEDGTLDTNKSPVVDYDIRFGNKCNLKCRMCGPSDSDFWYKDYVTLYGNTFHDADNLITIENNNSRFAATGSNYKWFESDNFKTQLSSKMHNIQKMYLVGGEPLLIKEHFVFLQQCIDADVAQNISLDYNTNLTKITQRTIDLWKHFKKVHVGASIDGFGKVLEYQRHPVKWSQINKTLHTLNDVARENKNIKVSLSTTVSVYNVCHIPEFLEWKLTSNLKHINYTNKKLIINYHMVHNPQCFNVQVLPNNIKHSIKELYDSFLIRAATNPELYKHYNNLEITLTQIINYMFMKTLHPTELTNFIIKTKELDQLRNENILNVVPQYHSLFI